MTGKPSTASKLLQARRILHVRGLPFPTPIRRHRGKVARSCSFSCETVLCSESLLRRFYRSVHTQIFFDQFLFPPIASIFSSLFTIYALPALEFFVPRSHDFSLVTVFFILGQFSLCLFRLLEFCILSMTSCFLPERCSFLLHSLDFYTTLPCNKFYVFSL